MALAYFLTYCRVEDVNNLTAFDIKISDAIFAIDLLMSEVGECNLMDIFNLIGWRQNGFDSELFQWVAREMDLEVRREGREVMIRPKAGMQWAKYKF